MKRIRIKIAESQDRINMISALAKNGYFVKIEEKEVIWSINPDRYIVFDVDESVISEPEEKKGDK